jgi:hypothetical protein
MPRAKAYFKSTCEYCGFPIWGIRRELVGSGGVMRNSWSHVEPSRKTSGNGLHGAFPTPGDVVQIERAEFALLSKNHR